MASSTAHGGSHVALRSARERYPLSKDTIPRRFDRPRGRSLGNVMIHRPRLDLRERRDNPAHRILSLRGSIGSSRLESVPGIGILTPDSVILRAWKVFDCRPTVWFRSVAAEYEAKCHGGADIASPQPDDKRFTVVRPCMFLSPSEGTGMFLYPPNTKGVPRGVPAGEASTDFRGDSSRAKQAGLHRPVHSPRAFLLTRSSSLGSLSKSLCAM